MQRIFRSTTALVAILGIAAPTLTQAQDAAAAPPTIRLAQGDAPVVVVPPGQEPRRRTLDQAAEEANEAAREEENSAEESEPAVVAPAEEAAPRRERARAAEEEPAEAEEAAPRRERARAAEEEPAEAEEEAPRRERAAEEAPARSEAEGNEPVVIPQRLDEPRREPERAESNDEPEVVAPENDEPAPRAAERARQSDEPAVIPQRLDEPRREPQRAESNDEPEAVAPESDEPAPRAAERARGGDDPVVVAPEDQGNAVRAATGQSEAPRVVAPDAAGLAEALEAAQSGEREAEAEAEAEAEQPRRAADGNRDGSDPVVVVPEGEGAAAVAAARGGPVVAEALDADVDDVGNAKAVVVTEESARSSSEDFATSVAAAAAAAANGGPVVTDAQTNGNGNGNDPVVVAPGQVTEARNNDDDDDTLGTLAGIAAAGLAVYAAGQILDNNQGRVALNTGDRVVVQAPDGSQQIWRDDDALLLRPGSEVATENFADGSSRSVVTRADGSRVVTIRDAQLRVLRRTLIAPDGTPTELINDAAEIAPVDVSRLPPPARVLPVGSGAEVSTSDLRAALEQEAGVDRRFSLGQIRNISQVRNLVAPISIDSITFDTGSAAIPPSQAQQLSTLGSTIADMVRANPREVFLIEGYTDTVGQPASNLALSDRRAESLALALTEYFGVPPENMVVQGYGETFLRVNAEGDVRENRRVAVRRITDLLQQ